MFEPRNRRRVRLGTSPVIVHVKEILAGESLSLVMPMSGLADRLLLLSGFLALCEIIGKKPIIYWAVNEWCNGKLSDLFALDFRCEELNAFGLGDNQLWKLFQGESGCENIFAFRGGTTAKDVYELLRKKLIPTDISCRVFRELAIKNLRSLQLQPHIQKIMEEFKIHHFSPSPIIGIHVRRTDKIMKKELINRPTHINENWLQKADKDSFELIGKTVRPGESVFLACDNARYQEKMRQFLVEHGCTPIIYTKEFSAGLRQTSLSDALCDMYLLSQCKKILCCGPSGFPVVAAQIGNIPLVSIQVAPRPYTWAATLRHKMELGWYRHFHSELVERKAF